MKIIFPKIEQARTRIHEFPKIKEPKMSSSEKEKIPKMRKMSKKSHFKEKIY